MSHRPIKVRDHRHCDNVVIMVLVCYVISQGRVIKGS